MIKVMVVDDQRLIRDGLKIMIEIEEDLQWIGEASNGREAFERAQELLPDVILMDIRMADSNGVEGTHLIKQWSPHTKVLILTTFDDDHYVIEALKEGASGYILKDIPAEELFESIRTVYQGGAVMPPIITAKLLKYLQNQQSDEKHDKEANNREANNKEHKQSIGLGIEDGLTVREREIALLIGGGYSNREMAEQLFISEGTVKNHVSNIMHKLNVRERSHIVIYALTGHKPNL